MIGYHHVLMIIIAVAIILLCECLSYTLPSAGMWLTNCSTSVGRLLFIVPTDPQHIPYLPVL